MAHPAPHTSPKGPKQAALSHALERELANYASAPPPPAARKLAIGFNPSDRLTDKPASAPPAKS